MKLHIERDAFAEAVAWVARTLPTRPTNPVLSGVLLTADGGIVTLSSSDQAVSSQVGFSSDVAEPGEAVVSGRLLAEIAKSLPPRPTDIALEGTKLVLTCDRSVFTLPTLPVADYPALPALPPLLGSCSGSQLADAVASVAIAASRDDVLPTLTGVRIEFESERITLAATDRFRLAIRELPWSCATEVPQGDVLVRAKTLADVARPLAAVGSVDLALDAGRSLIGFTGGQRRTTTPLLDGDFPDYRRLLPKSSETISEVVTAELIESVKRVKLVVERTSVPIQLLFSDGEVILQAGVGEDACAEETMECNHQGDPLRIAFNPGFLLDGLTALDCEKVKLAMKQPNKPVVLSNANGDESYQYLLMPVRLSE